MWHSFTTLPLVAKIIGLIGVAGLAAGIWLKRKAIATLTAALGNAASNRLWGYVGKKVQSAGPQADLKLVVGVPPKCQWYIGAVASTPAMAVQVPINFAHNEKDLSIIIKRAYLKGTQEAVPIVPIVVDGPYCPEETVHMMLMPIIAKPEKPLRGRVVFVDQFNRKHVTDELTFTPHCLPPESRGAEPITCFFCHKAVQPDDLAHNSYVTAHTNCIWK